MMQAAVDFEFDPVSTKRRFDELLYQTRRGRPEIEYLRLIHSAQPQQNYVPSPVPVKLEPELPPPSYRAAPLPAPAAHVARPVQPAVAHHDLPKPPTPKFDLPIAQRQAGTMWQRRQHSLVANINRSLPPGCHVLAWNIVPTDLFLDSNGTFMTLGCDFYAHAPANTLLLPATQAGTQYLQLPRHPLQDDVMLKMDAARQVEDLKQRVLAAHLQICQLLRGGSLAPLQTTVDRQARYREDMRALAKKIATGVFGATTIAAHDKLFGALIQAM